MQYLIDTRVKDPTKLLKEIIKRPIIGHNLKYDYQVIKQNYGVELNDVFDTMLAEQVLDCGSFEGIRKGWYGLAQVSHRRVGIDFYSSQGNLFLPTITKELQKSFTKQGDTPFSLAQLLYAALDVEATYRTYSAQQIQIVKDNLEATIELENEYLKVLGDMELVGVFLNQKQWLDNYRQTLLATEKLREMLSAYAPIN